MSIQTSALGQAGLSGIPLEGASGVLGLKLLPATVLGPRAIPTAVILGGAAGVIVPAAVGPHRSIPTPSVVGPISLAGPVIGPRSIPAPTIPPLIRMTATPSGPRSIPSPRVANVETIRPAGPVLGPRSIPAPSLSGGPQWIRAYPTKGPRAIPVPELTGGSSKLTLFIAGADATSHLSWVENTCTIQSQTFGRWQATLDLFTTGGVSSFKPHVGDTILFVDYGRRVFMGCLTEVIIDRFLMTADQITYHCTATDKSGILDHRVITGKTYATGADVAATILDILSNFAYGEGIIATGIPVDGSLGTLPVDLVCNFIPVSQGFDQIGNYCGLVWWIDVFGALRFSPLVDLPAAPFAITSSSNNWRQAQGYEGLTVTQSVTSYADKVYVVSDKNVLPGVSGGTGGGGSGNTETFHWTAGTPGIFPPNFPVPSALLLSTPAASISSITVNGNPQTVVDFGLYTGQTPSGTDYVWTWEGPSVGSPGAIVTPLTPPPSGATIVVVYVPYVATASSLAQTGMALAPPAGTCGSGIHEVVIQVKDITDQAQLDSIGAAWLARVGGTTGSPPKMVDYETDYPGLAPGQIQHCDIPEADLADTDVLITKVSGVLIAPTLENGGSFRWQIEGTTNLDPGNLAAFYERLVARTNNPLPLLQGKEATFILGAGSSLAGGASLTNPKPVGTTGKLTALTVAAGSPPPVGVNLVLTLTRNGTPIASITLPGGTAANTLVTSSIAVATPIYLFAGDVLNCNASYVVTGSSTSRASNVTFTALWQS